MPSTAIPTKTPAGVDELKHRVRRLSQRHRTVLLLVDGRRALGEVLALSLKAGSSTQHFQELLELGLVTLPRAPEPPPPPDSGPGALDDLRVESVELPVVIETPGVEDADGPVDPPLEAAADLPAEVAPSQAAPAPVQTAEPTPAHTEQAPRAVAPSAPTPEAPVEALRAWLAAELPPPPPADAFADGADDAGALPPVTAPAPFPASPALPATPSRPAPAPMRLLGDLLEAGPRFARTPWQLPPEVAAPATQLIGPEYAAALPTAAPAGHLAEWHDTDPGSDAALADDFEHLELPLAEPDEAEARLLTRVRELLADTLSFDSPLFSARMLVRVRMAPGRRELVNLVWEVERHLRHARRGAVATARLYEARELLGMGNTHVAGESQYGAFDDED